MTTEHIEPTFEKMGLLYLGRELDLQGRPTSNAPFLYKNKNLTTHGIIIGMTGSGKTGLGIGLIEEAIMDNVPSIIIDPKGDMGNLLLTFPECRPDDFVPWVDSAEAARNNLSKEEFAAETACRWQQGLAEWGQDTSRIAELRQKTEMTIYTPGSSAGVPLSVLAGFTAPDSELLEESDTINSMVSAAVSSLLALVDIKGDPLQSKEHILLSSLLLYHWRRGESPDIEQLIGGIVMPPFSKVGVFPLETFYPQTERMALAMRLNNIIASPAFTAWREGEPLDIQKLLYTEEGTPRTAIFSIAHLSDGERMFFVTMLLNRFIGWMRRQQGASSLKALFYMDEIFGYFPPIANPPSKKPMMLLLKQARAFGIGVVLATQNPVDLDYRGLSNIGSWFVGRLQTKQDQNRVIEGIVSASDDKLDAVTVREMLADMQGRQFLLNSIHLEAPILFATRWVMSYLKGPMTNDDIKSLTQPSSAKRCCLLEEGQKRDTSVEAGNEGTTPPPVLAKGIEQRFYLPASLREMPIFTPYLAVRASVRFYNAKRNIDKVKKYCQKLYLEEDFMYADWEQLIDNIIDRVDCVHKKPDNARFYALAPSISSLKDLRTLKKEYMNYLYQHHRLELFRVNELKIESKPDETFADFKIQVADTLREKREAEIEKLQTRYAKKQQVIEDRLMHALAKVEKEQQDVQAKTADTLISFGTAVLGAFFGRKTFSATNIRKAATGVRKAGRLAKERGDVQRAEDIVEDLQRDIEQLALELKDDIAIIDTLYKLENYEIETFSIKPRRADIFDVEIYLLWEAV